MSRELISPTPSVEFATSDDLKQWLFKQGDTHKSLYLLAHAEDGVMWGRFDQGRLITAEQAFPNLDLPKLRLTTLQRCWIFGETGEVLLWRSHNIWKYRFVGNPDCDYISEAQMLWGTHKARKKDGTEIEESQGFTLVEDGSEGLRHAVPLVNIPFSCDRSNLVRPLRLKVHHYVDYDENGVARIYLSRLVNLDK